MCFRLDGLTEQNASRVSRRKDLPAKYLRDTTVSIWADSLHSSMCRAHNILGEMLSREIPAKSSSVFKCLSLHTTFSITQPLQSNPIINTRYKRLNRITIKFGTELKPTKHIVVNHNFTIVFFIFYYFT